MRMVSPVAAVTLMLAAAPVAALAQTAPAPATLTDIAVGNTLEVDYPDVPGHPHVTFKMMADGTFTSLFPGDIAGSGDYVTDARYVCWITKVPVETTPGANARCEANTTAGKAVGDSWTMTDSMGAKAVITVTPGQ